MSLCDVRRIIKIVFAGVALCAFFDVRAQEKKEKFVRVYTYNNVDLLEIRPGFHPLHQSYILGDLVLGDSGVRFTPRKIAPEGITDARFKSHWWYNPLFQELYIPYSEIESVKTHSRLKITTTDGRKYKIVTKKLKKNEADIKAHIAAIKKSGQADRAHAGD